MRPLIACVALAALFTGNLAGVPPLVPRSFFAALDRIADPAYKASEQDIMRSRTRTTGITQEAYVIDDVPFE